MVSEDSVHGQKAGSKAGASWWKGLVEHNCLAHGGKKAEQGNSTREERGRDQTGPKARRL